MNRAEAAWQMWKDLKDVLRDAKMSNHLYNKVYKTLYIEPKPRQ